MSSIIIDSSNGSRCVVYRNPQGLTLSPDQRCNDLLEDCPVILLDGFYLKQAITVAQKAQGRSLIVLDGGSWKEGLKDLLPFIDYAICSADFRAPGCSSDEDLLGFLEDAGVKGAAISHGAEPIIYLTEGTQGCLSIPQVDAVDTLGAGDILHGTFCHHILTNPFPKSLEMAALSASHSCLSYGTRKWLSHYNDQGYANEIR